MKRYILCAVSLNFLALALAGPPRPERCNKALGMESKQILDQQISASSEKYPSSRARINKWGAWLPVETDFVNPWIEVNFILVVRVAKILTQGRSGTSQWVTKYAVSYWKMDRYYNLTEQDRRIKEFSGNTDRDTPVENSLLPKLETRVIRIHILAYHEKPALRLEFFGCYSVCPNPKRLGVSKPEKVSDSQMFASSEFDNPHAARWGRLEIQAFSGLHNGIWIKKHNDNNGWLGIDFLYLLVISSILTQGRASGDPQWTKSFKISSSVDGSTYEFYTESGTEKIFTGNTDRNTIVENTFSPVIAARFIRVHPVLAHGDAALRVEFKGCASGDYAKSICLDPAPLGMESGLILESQLSASSQYNRNSKADNGRLNFQKTSTEYGGWKATDWDIEPWFMVDFLSSVKLTKIILAKPDDESDTFVELFEIDYGENGITFQSFIDAKNEKTFSFGSNTVNNKKIHPSFIARFVRIRLTKCQKACAMRTEFYGCYVASEDPQPLGMENKDILDSQITASSVKDRLAAAIYARLNLQATSGVHYGCWIKKGTDDKPWLQVDFLKNTLITAIDVHGRPDDGIWIKTYNVSYSKEGHTFQIYEEFGVQKVFTANVDRNTVVRNTLPNVILARYIRVHPKSWEQSPALRLEFIGTYVETNDCYQQSPFGMHNDARLIKDDQISSSSEFTPAWRGRIDHTGGPSIGGWIPNDSDNNPWFQVDLILIATITIIGTQGQHEDDKRLTKTYTLAYNKGGTDFEYYKNATGQIRIFQGNVDHQILVVHYLYPRIIARKIRLYAGECGSDGCCIRMELWGCYKECVNPLPLGMENGEIKGSQLSVSSKSNKESGANNGRLNVAAKPGVNIGAWMANAGNPPHHYKVDFLQKIKLYGILTQGRQDDVSWTKTFSFCYGVKEDNYRCYKEHGNLRIFSANNDRNTIVKQVLDRPIVLCYIKIKLETWYKDPVLRLEFLGSHIDPVDQCMSSPCQNGTCEDGFETFTCNCSPGFAGELCDLECVKPVPLGMSNRHIDNGQITASSQKSQRTSANRARLNGSTINLLGGWTAENINNEWFQVDFLMQTYVSMVITKGRLDSNYWTETYSISYSDDGVLFMNYSQGIGIKVFNGNVDRDTHVNNTLLNPIFTRFLRINPITCYAKCALRAEFYGCYLDCTHPRPLGMENGYIKDDQLSSSSAYSDTRCCEAARGRLGITTHLRSNSWVPGAKDTTSWVKVDFITDTSVSGIMTQGGSDNQNDMWVINYTMSYSKDGQTFQHYLENNETKIFQGNNDSRSIVSNYLSPFLVLKSIQINPQFCHERCALRVEFLGCYKDIDVCQSQPCQHGSTCTEKFDDYNTFNCTCPQGYTGKLCETDINDCLSYPCQHGGTCTDLVNAINCTCLNGYTGDLCETAVGPCHSDPCQNNATCNNTGDGFNCTCALGYYGELCSEIDHCASSPCLNNATCINNGTDFTCNCSEGYFGDVCELKDWCNPQPCLHSGNCSLNQTSYQCNCPYLYIGKHCETENHIVIKDLAVEPIPAQEFGKNISVTWSVSDGTYLSILVLYNTILCCNSSVGHIKEGSCICAVSNPASFDPDGMVDITVTAWNLVSNLSLTLQIEVLKKIRDASIQMLTTYSDFGSGVEGVGNLRNTFPAEYPVKFEAFYLDGSVNTSQWGFRCTGLEPSFEHELTFEKTFSGTSQDCDVYLVLRNGVSEAQTNRTIILKESVILTSFTNNGPVKLNKTTTFTILLSKLAAETCLWVDLGDNSPLIVFGDVSCPDSISVDKIAPNIVQEPRLKYTHKSSDTQTIVFNHIYSHVGSYDVRMGASNEVSMVTEQLVAVILALECENPNVTITGLTPNSSNILNAVQVYRSSEILLKTQQEINCEITDETTVSWKVYKFDDDPRKVLLRSQLRKTLFNTVSTSDLHLLGRFLPYGFYEIVVRAEMRGLLDVFGSDLIHVQVIQTPWLEAAVTAGSFYTIPYGFEGSLNASASINPDFVGTDEMSFTWLCRDVDDRVFLISNLQTESLISIPHGNDSTFDPAQGFGGCFDTGRGRLNSTERVLQLDTRTMTEDKTYTISLVVGTESSEFGPRRDIVNIFFYVARGLPPELSTSCSKNCREKVIPDEKIILTSSCSSYCYGKLSFSWALYMYDDLNMPEPFNLTDLHTFSPEEFQNMASSPTNQLDIAIKPHSLTSGRKYIMAFRAIRPSGVYGELRYTMLVNSPPNKGNCSISLLSGIAMKTSFTISCDNWIDPDAPLSYEFSYPSNGIRNVYFYATALLGEKVTSTNWLPIGDKENDFDLIVTVQVKDKFGSIAKQDYTIKVYPPSDEELNMDDLQNLVTGSESSLAKLNDNDDVQRALSLASSMAAALNYRSKDATMNGTTSASYDKDISKQIRLQLLTSISQQNTSIVDVSSLEQTSATVVSLVENTDELNSEAKDAALGICGALTDSLKTLSDNDAGFRNVQRGAKNLVNIIGKMSGSFTQDKAQNTTDTESHVPEQVKHSVDLVEKIQAVLLDNIVSTEGPVDIETDTLSLQVEKVTVQDIGQHASNLKNSEFKVPSLSAIGLGEIGNDPNNTFLQMQPVEIKMAVFKDNPFIWDGTSENISSNVFDVVLSSTMNISTSNFSEDVSLKIPRDPSQFPPAYSFYLKPNEKNSTSKTKTYLKYHCFTRTSKYTSMNFEMYPEEPGIRFKVYLKKGGKPNVKDGDFMHFYELPDLNNCTVNNENVFNSQFNESEENSTDHLEIESKSCLKDPYTVFVSNTDFNGTGKYCFAIENISPFDETEENDNSKRRKRSVSCEVGAKRVRRSCVIIPPAPPKPTAATPVEILVADNLGFDGKFFFPNQTPNYNLTMFQSSCMHWNVENESWAGEGCKVALGTNKEAVVCSCSHLTSFGSDLLVAPNPIDFDSVFKNFGSLAENVAVLALISTILGLYIIGVIWARRADKRDELMVGPTILSKPKGSYHYLITTYTGTRQGAGTTARVVFKMNGDDGETQPVRLKDRHRPCFQRGQENAFVVSYPQGIGDLSYLQIWHDNKGSSPSWYLSRMSVKDLQTGKTWPLFCENWFAVESDDGKVYRILSVANEQEMVSFGHLFSTQAIKGLADGHIWFSIVSRPPTSNFTRVQRLSCALCLLCCTMITSAMFYNMGGQGPSPFAIHIGSLIIDLKPFVIGLQSSVIIVPVNVLLVQIFRNLRPKKSKISAVDNEHKTQGKPQAPKGKLPHWFIFIAYAICYLASAASIFFTLLYSIQWGKETSTEWVIAMVTSFFQSMLLLQPIKIVLVAVVFALLIKKPSDMEEESNGVPIIERKTKIDKSSKQMKKYYSPPDPKTLQKAREKRLKELKMNAALKEIFTFFFFLILLMDVAQYHRDPNTFFLTKTLSETFDEVDEYSIDLAAVSDGDSLWMWSRETLIPGLYSTEWYNGKKMPKGWLANMEVYLVGVPRLRLLRVEEDSCTMSKYVKDMIEHCYAGYSMTSEEDKSFNVGWEPLQSTTSRKRRDINAPDTEKEWFKFIDKTSNTKSLSEKKQARHKRAMDPISSSNSGKNRRKKKRLLASSNPKVYTINDNVLLSNGKVMSCLQRWEHQSMMDLRGFPYWGTITMYSGSGYVANLGYDQITAYTVVSDLHSNGWIDVQSRAVFVEFTVYNANTNLFGIISIFIEFLPSSGAITKAQFEASRFYLHLTGGQTLAHVLVIFFMLYFLFREGKLAYKQRWTYFKGFWNWVEVILIVCEFLLIVLFLARLYEVDRNLLQLRENPNDYVSFQYAANADTLMTCVIGVLVFFYILRFLRLLRFNKNFLVIGKTLSRISAPILSFCLPFISGFFAFALLAFSTFGSELEDYSSFVRTLVTQLSMALGDFDFEAIFMVNPTVATLYFFSFIGLNVMVLMNMFIAIINDTYAEVQEETADLENELEIIEYVTVKAANFIPGKKSKVVPIRKKKGKKRKLFKTVLKPDEQSLYELVLREERLENILNSVEQILEEEELMEERFCSMPKEKQKDSFLYWCILNENYSEWLDDGSFNLYD